VPQAKAAYQKLFALWKNADPGIPMLTDAQSEFTRLQGWHEAGARNEARQRCQLEYLTASSFNCRKNFGTSVFGSPSASYSSPM